MNSQDNPSTIAKRGEELYFSSIQSQLEPEHTGEYVVIEINHGNYVVNSDPVAAIHEAQQKYPGELFHIIRVGFISKPTVNYNSFSL